MEEAVELGLDWAGVPPKNAIRGMNGRKGGAISGSEGAEPLPVRVPLPAPGRFKLEDACLHLSASPAAPEAGSRGLAQVPQL